MKQLFRDMVKDPGSYVILAILVLIVAGALYVIATSGVDAWRYTYCQASEAHAIECTVKGWW